MRRSILAALLAVLVAACGPAQEGPQRAVYTDIGGNTWSGKITFVEISTPSGERVECITNSSGALSCRWLDD